MFIKNKDLNTMIKMENVIGMFEKQIWGEHRDRPYKMTIYGSTYDITHNDFIDYMNLIENILKAQQEASAKANAYNKAHKEYHNITVNMAHYKKKGNLEKYNYWKNKLKEYKEREVK